MENKIRFGMMAAAIAMVFVLLAGCSQNGSANANYNSSYSAPSSPSSPGYSSPSSPAPSSPYNGGGSGNAGGSAGTNTTYTGGPNNGYPAPQGSGSVSPSSTCALSLDSGSIQAGSSVIVRTHVYASHSEQATFLCGSNVESMGSGGLFDEWKLCQFNTPGHVEVWAALNGQVCASAPLEVVPANTYYAANGTCSFVPGSRNTTSSDGLRTYQATVQFANFSAGSTLTWDCQWRSFSHDLGAMPFGSAGTKVSGTAIVNCEYASDPGVLTSLPVRINGQLCGDLLQG